MTTKKLAASDELAAGTTRRGAGALPLALYNTPRPPTSQTAPPSHLVGDEIGLWLRAEELRSNGDRDEYWQARRALLLAQAARWEAER